MTSYDPQTLIQSYEQNAEMWSDLKRLELELCTRPELLGAGLHLLFVARKEPR